MATMLIFILGCCMGSFISVLHDHWPHTWLHLKRRRSQCDTCHRPLPFLDLIPLFSWLYLKGHCRFCQTNIPLRHVIYELTGGAGLLFSTLSACTIADTLIQACLFFTGFFVAGIDWRYRLIPLPSLMILAIISGIALSLAYMRHGYQALWHSSLGIAFMGSLVLCSTLIHRFWKKNWGIGQGDIYLLLLSSLWIKASLVPLLITLSGGLGVLCGFISNQENSQVRIPFAPAILLAWWIMVVTCSTF